MPCDNTGRSRSDRAISHVRFNGQLQKVGGRPGTDCPEAFTGSMALLALLYGLPASREVRPTISVVCTQFVPLPWSLRELVDYLREGKGKKPKYRTHEITKLQNTRRAFNIPSGHVFFCVGVYTDLTPEVSLSNVYSLYSPSKSRKCSITSS